LSKPLEVIEEKVLSDSEKKKSRLSERVRSRSKSDSDKRLPPVISPRISNDLKDVRDNLPPIISNNEFSFFPPEGDQIDVRDKEHKQVFPNLPNYLADEVAEAEEIIKVAPKLSIAEQKELKFKKMECLAKLMHIKSLNIELSKHYNMESDLEDMEMELKYHSDIQNRKNGIELAKSFLFNGITAIEFLNDRYDPFGFQLSGWSDQVKLNKEDYNEVFGELIDKYKRSTTKMEPEVKLALMLGMSAASFHATKAMASSLPGIEDVVKSNPELINKIRSNINKSINKSVSGPTELEKKKEVYNQVKKYHQQVTNPVSSKPNVPAKTTSVKNLLQDIKASIPLNTVSDSITLGETIDTSSDTSVVVSKNVKTKSRLASRKNIQNV
jgi:hypothetical protein